MVTATQERIVFEAQAGPQSALIACPFEDIFFGGARGGSKTWGLAGDWISHQDQYGEFARGIFFRRTYDELDEVQRVFNLLFPPLGAVYRSQPRTWYFPSKATLKMRFLDRDQDATKYQGHSYTWMGFDELTNWPSPSGVDMLRACLRQGEAPVPKSLRCTGNPGGPGHNWVKARYIDPAPPYTPFYDQEMETWRVFIPSRLEDNPALLKNDPDYWKRVVAAAAGNKALLEAWRWGNWDIVAGGMFDDLFRRDVHVIKPFPIPASWFCNRSFDWGSSRPFSVGWWAESDGTEAPNGRTYPRGTLFRFAEWYGWTGKPNTGLKMLARDIAKGILEQEKSFGCKVYPGPADSSIFDVQNGNSIGDDMAAAGVQWMRADKSPGSRKIGWERFRGRLGAGLEFPMEDPGIFIFDNCLQWIRTVPVLARDSKKIDDVDTTAEDHAADETRYRILAGRVAGAY